MVFDAATFSFLASWRWHAEALSRSAASIYRLDVRERFNLNCLCMNDCYA